MVTNGGYSLKNPREDEWNIPLKQVSRDISNLDVKGKVVEVKNFTFKDLKHKFALATQKSHPAGMWFDMRGLGGTLANEIAVERGATRIIKFDSDQVAFKNARKVKGDPRSLILKQHEFCGDIHHLCIPGPDDPWNDSVFTYLASLEDYYGGGMGPHITEGKGRVKCNYECAHLRHANPLHLSEEQKFQHFYGRLVFRLHTNEFGRFCPELFKKAEWQTKQMLKVRGKKSHIKPPEVTVMGPKRYIEEVTG